VPIVHLVSRPASGGIRTHLEGLLADLPESGWDPVLHAPKTLLDSLYIKHPNISAFSLNIAPSLSQTDLNIGRKLASQVKSGSIVHAHGVRGAWIAAIARLFKHFRLIVTLHNVPPKGLAGQLAMYLISHTADEVVCVSEMIARTSGIPGALVIPNGVFCREPIEQRRTMTDVTTSESFTALCVSRLSYEKGVDLLLDAAKRLPEITFRIAGDGPLMDKLSEAAPENAAFLGQRDDIAELMASADCVVAPSRSEGQGIVVLEAFAAGIPVVAASVGGLLESIVDGETGVLVEPENPSALAAGIDKLRNNRELAEKMAGNAGNWVRQHRRRQNQSARLAQLYATRQQE